MGFVLGQSGDGAAIGLWGGEAGVGLKVVLRGVRVPYSLAPNVCRAIPFSFDL